MDKTTTKHVKKYFAAANSYNGFISYFDKVFSSEEYDRIYVLKGGPGTGKSSLMRSFSSKLLSNELDIEEIYCSSDPHSLDGVIASKGNAKIAFIDGTAPHERDAVIPGAIDEIINLGENWRSDWLVSQRAKILSLATEKSKAYKCAYKYLGIAGKASKEIDFYYKNSFADSKAKNVAESFISNISSSKISREKIRLISSFGRYGNFQLDPWDGTEVNYVDVSGNETSASLLLNVYYNNLKFLEVDMTVYPSALDPSKIDALELQNHGIVIRQSEEGEINANDFVNLSLTDKERIKKAEIIKHEALEEAKRWFSIASDIHFNLEEIYSKSMDFTKNDEIINNKLTEIKNIIENSR